ncbi:MAG: hypothetical protein M3O28_07845, partial [Actinomycetota bacterium]|nr:hypothetical protein [Actinomycetota bacterium]
HEVTRAEYLRAQRRLDAARRAEAVRALLDTVDDAQETLRSAQHELRSLGAALTDEHLLGTGADEAARQGAAADKAAAELEHLVRRESEVAGVQDELRAVQVQLQAAEQVVAQSAQRSQTLPRELSALEATLSRLRSTIAESGPAAAQLESAEHRLAAATRLAALLPQIGDLDKRVATAIATHQTSVDEHQRLLENRFSGMAAEIAGSLVPGAPCAVCGSLEHPALARPGSDAVSAVELDTAAQRRQDAELRRAELERDAAALAIEASSCEAIADGGQVQALRTQIDALHLTISAGERAAQELVRCAAEHRVLTDEAAAIPERYAKAEAQRATIAARLAQLTESAAELTESIHLARGQSRSVVVRQQELLAQARLSNALAAALRLVAGAASALDDAEQRATREAIRASFASSADAKQAVLGATEQATLTSGAAEWLAESQLLAAAVSSAEFAGVDLGTADGLRQEAERATRLAAAAERMADQAAAVLHQARVVCTRFAERVREVESAQQALDRLSAEREPVQYLSRLTRGMTGRRRVALTTYVLRHWFEHVVQAANVRLTAISAGRYELVRVDEGASKSERTGLTLQVIDRHTGEARSTRSLSGGETFYTSLALALGLADVVKAEAGGVDLDTLFIDEGFGSLDADTLDEVMSVIDELRDRGRVVGIVSHIADLKHRIPERVEVRRLGNGSSTVRVVA